MRRLFWFSLAFALASGIYALMMPGAAALIAAGVCGLLSLGARLLRDRRLLVVRIFLLGTAFALVWCYGYQAACLGSAARYDGETAELSALALDAPSESAYGESVPVEIRLDGKRLKAVLYLSSKDNAVEPGDTIRCTAKLKLAPGSTEQSEDRFYRSRGAWFVLSARGDVEVIKAEAAALRFAPARFAEMLREKLAQLFDKDAAGFLSALLTGERSGLSRQTRNELSISGIYHTVAVSGMHVSILLGLIMLLCGGRKRLAAAIGLPAIVFFVLATGAPASAVRAGCMQALLLLAPLAKRENDPITSLGAAGLVILMLNPWALFDVGFQLSFASSAGILLFARKLYRRLGEGKRLSALLPKRNAAGRLASGALTSLCVSMSSTVFSLPLAAYYFGTVSLVAPLVNLLTLWAVTVCFAGGLLTALLGFVWTGIAYGPAWLLGWLVKYVLLLARAFSKLPFAALYPESFYIAAWCVLLYAVVLLTVLLPVRPRLRVTLGCLAGTFLLTQVLAYAQFHMPYFTFTALDVGQGQCLLYQRGSWTAVIDCGGSDAWEAGESMARWLKSRGEARVEALVITHYDADHAGGAVQLLERERVDAVYLPDAADDSGIRAEIVRKAKARGSEVIFVREDTELSFEGGCVRIFAPVSDRNSNESGISVLASAGEYDMLITGDMTRSTELRLLEQKQLPATELLVAGHHGAETSTGYALLNRLRPQTVLISVGADNAYGHPAPETLERIEAVGAAVYRTDVCGTITIRGPIYGKTGSAGGG